MAQEAFPVGCFARDYSADHLAAHPEQGIAALAIEFFEDGDWPGESYFFVRALMSDQGQAARDGVEGLTLYEGGTCRHGNRNCFVDCDGGGFDLISWEGDMIMIATRGMRLTLEGCDSDAISSLNESYDGETRYRLIATQPEACSEF
jgi:hypothetical protein